MKNNKTYLIFIRSNEHPRTINTPANGRTYYSRIDFIGTKEELKTKIAQLKANGEIISEICTPLGTRIWL